MATDGYTPNKPTEAALYWMRRIGSVDGGRVVQTMPPDKYKLPHDDQLFPLPDGYGSTNWLKVTPVLTKDKPPASLVRCIRRRGRGYWRRVDAVISGSRELVLARFIYCHE